MDTTIYLLQKLNITAVSYSKIWKPISAHTKSTEKYFSLSKNIYLVTQAL
jgi:type II secretory pathway component PulM